AAEVAHRQALGGALDHRVVRGDVLVEQHDGVREVATEAHGIVTDADHPHDGIVADQFEFGSGVHGASPRRSSRYFRKGRRAKALAMSTVSPSRNSRARSWPTERCVR